MERIKYFIVILFGMLLTACTSTGMTAVQLAYNRYEWQQTVEDHYITLQAYQVLNKHAYEFANTHFSVTTLNQVVLLTGQAPTMRQRLRAEALIRQIPHVKKVHNYITLNQPISTLVQVSDAWLTAKIKLKLLAQNQVNPAEISVVTENGTVYLRGKIPVESRSYAATLARNTEGVQQVVSLLSYIVDS